MSGTTPKGAKPQSALLRPTTRAPYTGPEPLRQLRGHLDTRWDDLEGRRTLPDVGTPDPSGFAEGSLLTTDYPTNI
jgi:hypothetical protein